MTDTLIVYLSGDAWQGDAEATITINGVSVSGTLDVQAANIADATQAFQFTGDFGASPAVALSFVNDAYGGTAAEDRNLYLDGFSYDGVEQLNVKNELSYDQTDTYSLHSTPAPALRVADFSDSLGVDVHLDYWDTSYGLADGSGGNEALVQASASYLGITNLRVGVPTAATLPEMQALAAAGLRFDVLMPSTSSPTLLASQLAALAPIAGAVASIEGPNEVNVTSDFSWDAQTTLAAAAEYQQALYAAVRDDPAFNDTLVYNLTLGGVGADTYAGLGDLSSAATDGNVHVYFQDGTPPASTLRYALGLADASTPSDPAVITETNYASAPMIAGAVSEDVQARYDLDLLMDATADGYNATYFYELLDEHADPGDTNGENHFGLFNADGSPKPAATAIHNLDEILSDAGPDAASFTPGSLPYSVAGLPASGDTLVLESSSGTYDVVVWAEPEIWDAATGMETAAASHSVTVSFSGSYDVKVFDPLTGKAALSSASGQSVVTVTVTDHPIILQVSASAALPPVAPASLSLAAARDSGTIGDEITNVTMPVVTGTGTPGDTILLYDGATTIGTAVVAASGVFAVASAVALSDGPHALSVRQSDSTSVLSAASAVLDIDIASTPPAAPSTPVLSASGASGTQGDAVTSVLAPSFVGTGTPGDVITLQDGSTALGSSTVGADGTWSFTTSTELAAGIHMVSAAQTDVAGSTSASSPDLTFLEVVASSAAAAAPVVTDTTGVTTLSGGTGTTFLTPAQGGSVATATALGNDEVISRGTDTVFGGGGSDLVYASGAAATVTGGAGNLTFVAGSGNYTAGGGSGVDVLYGGSGASTLSGGAGKGSVIVAGSGNTSLLGGLGSAAILFGGTGMDTLSGSAGGGDILVGGAGSTLFSLTNGDVALGGPAGVDQFNAGSGGAIIVEGAGSSAVMLGGGQTTVFGGAGPDTIEADGSGGGTASIIGFKSTDRIDLDGGLTSADAQAALAGAVTGSFGTALTIGHGAQIVLFGVSSVSASQLVL